MTQLKSKQILMLHKWSSGGKKFNVWTRLWHVLTLGNILNCSFKQQRN